MLNVSDINNSPIRLYQFTILQQCKSVFGFCSYILKSFQRHASGTFDDELVGTIDEVHRKPGRILRASRKNRQVICQHMMD